jgi:uridine kinase
MKITISGPVACGKSTMGHLIRDLLVTHGFTVDLHDNHDHPNGEGMENLANKLNGILKNNAKVSIDFSSNM